jgi:hypothetical protein
VGVEPKEVCGAAGREVVPKPVGFAPKVDVVLPNVDIEGVLAKADIDGVVPNVDVVAGVVPNADVVEGVIPNADVEGVVPKAGVDGVAPNADFGCPNAEVVPLPNAEGVEPKADGVLEDPESRDPSENAEVGIDPKGDEPKEVAGLPNEDVPLKAEEPDPPPNDVEALEPLPKEEG